MPVDIDIIDDFKRATDIIISTASDKKEAIRILMLLILDHVEPEKGTAILAELYFDVMNHKFGLEY